MVFFYCPSYITLDLDCDILLVGYVHLFVFAHCQLKEGIIIEFDSTFFMEFFTFENTCPPTTNDALRNCNRTACISLSPVYVLFGSDTISYLMHPGLPQRWGGLWYVAGLTGIHQEFKKKTEMKMMTCVHSHQISLGVLCTQGTCHHLDTFVESRRQDALLVIFFQ